MPFLAAILMAHSLALDPSTPMFPREAIEANENYRDWYGPELEGLGEKPLWIDSRDFSNREVIRFTFIPGAALIKGRDTTIIRIEITGRKARLIARTEVRDGQGRTIREVAHKEISSTELATLRRLSEQAETWKYSVGDWEEQKEGEISIHCTELLMERRQRSSYAVSHILISCNQPARLMPLVDYVAKLAGQKRKDLRY